MVFPGFYVRIGRRVLSEMSSLLCMGKQIEALWWRQQQGLGVEVRGLEGSGQVDGLEGGRQANKEKKQREGEGKKDKDMIFL